MLRAGALFVAVTIAFVIAVLTSLLILLSFHYKIQNRENLLQKKLERNANSAITLLLNGNTNEYKDIRIVDLYEEGTDSVELKVTSWGIFEVASVKAMSGRYNLKKSVQYGYPPDEMLSSAIYLTDLSKPLILCGNTTIKGNCYLPESGMKDGSLDGKPFKGKTLINGEVRKSKSILPLLNKRMVKKLTDQFSGRLVQEYKEVPLEEIDSLNNSFMDTTIVVIPSDHSLTISRKRISGNVIIYSEGSLIIEEDVILQDVQIIARDIKIRKGFKGNLQAFATDSIVVEEDCRLEYPSALGVFKKDSKTMQPFIRIMKGSELTGMLFSCQPEMITDIKQTLITVEKDALVTGIIYADGFADIKGEVKGVVLCNKFIAKSVHENYLLDAIIDRTELSSHYVGSAIVTSGSKKRIIKWLQ